MRAKQGVTGCIALLAACVVAIPTIAQEPVELEPCLEMRDQFEISLPAGWHVLDQEKVIAEITGRYNKAGQPIVFSAELIDGAWMTSPDPEMQRKVAELFGSVEVGSIPGFMVQRLPARKGMACSGFDKKGQKAVLDVLGGDPMFGRGRTVREKPYALPSFIGGCQGLRVRGKGQAATGAGKTLDAFVVSDGEIVYFFHLLNLDEHYAENIGTFEAIMSTVTLTAARTGGR